MTVCLHEISIILAIFAKHGRVHLRVEADSLWIELEDGAPYSLSTAEMLLLTEAGWRFDGWLDRWTKTREKVDC